MLKSGTFIKHRILRVILPTAITYAFLYAATFIDLSLAGILFDELAVSAIQIDLPINTIGYGIAGIFVSGAVVAIGKEKGKFNDRKADKLLGQAFLTAIVMGIIASIAYYYGRDSFLNMFNCSPEVFELAKQYFKWIVPMPLVISIRWVLMVVIEIDADAKTCVVSQMFSFFLNFIISYVCSRTMGIAGLSFGTVCAMTIEAFIMALHFIKKTNTFKFGIQFSIKDAKEIMIYGISEGARYFLVAIVDIAINLFISLKFGDIYLCVYAIINLLTDVLDSFSCVPETGNAFGSIFYGERNTIELKNLYKFELKMSLVVGGFFTLVTILFSKQIPFIYGINSSPTYEASVLAVLSIGGTSIVAAIMFIVIGGFSLIDQVKTSLLGLTLYSFIMPLALSITGSYLFGISGFIWGLALNPVFSFLICSIYLIIKNGFKGYPLYLKKTDEEVYTYDAIVNHSSIGEICNFIEDRLAENNIDKSLTMKIRLLCEELYTRIVELNKDRKIETECALMIGPSYIRLIVRDSGEMRNYIDIDNSIESFNAYCLARLITNDMQTNYSFTNSFNRNGFVFYRSLEKTV